MIKNYLFFSSLVEIGVKTAPLAQPRGPEERVPPGSTPGDLHRVMSHPRKTGFIHSVGDRAATDQLAKDMDLPQQFPAADGGW